MMMMMTQMKITMAKPCDYDDDTDDDTDDDNDHQLDSYTAAGAAHGASVPCSLFLVRVPLFRFLCSGYLFQFLVPRPLMLALWSWPFGPGPLVQAL